MEDSLVKYHVHYGNMGREEQIEEREVLDSIFPEEITGILAPFYLFDILY